MEKKVYQLLPTGRTYPYSHFKLKERYDILKDFETYYSVFEREIGEHQYKYYLFRNDLNGYKTGSYTAVGNEAGYDEISVCPIGEYIEYVFTAFLMLKDYASNHFDIVSLHYDEGAKLLVSAGSEEEAEDKLADIVGMKLDFTDCGYMKRRMKECKTWPFGQNADEFAEKYGTLFEWFGSPYDKQYDGKDYTFVHCQLKDGSFNIFDAISEVFVLPFGSEEMITPLYEGPSFQFKYKGTWFKGDLYGCLLEPTECENGWYGYDAIDEYLDKGILDRSKRQTGIDRSSYTYNSRSFGLFNIPSNPEDMLNLIDKSMNSVNEIEDKTIPTDDELLK